mgnify:CR=1 FL=1
MSPLVLPPESESRDHNELTPKEVEHPLDEDRNTTETGNSVAEDKNPDDDERASSSSATSVFQNFTVLRVIFLAAFSDGYNVCKWRK